MTQAGAMPATEPAGEAAAHRDKVGAEQVAALFRSAPMGVGAAAIGALMLTATLYRLGHVEVLTGDRLDRLHRQLRHRPLAARAPLCARATGRSRKLAPMGDRPSP